MYIHKIKTSNKMNLQVTVKFSKLRKRQKKKLVSTEAIKSRMGKGYLSGCVPSTLISTKKTKPNSEGLMPFFKKKQLTKFMVMR